MTLTKNIYINRMLNLNAFRRLLQVGLSVIKKTKSHNGKKSCSRKEKQNFYYHKEGEDLKLQIIDNKKNAILLSPIPLN